ncbi:hypothetical protein ACTI_62840 [Actinoplanes sp. OR16]|uniref:hypothetical protein n=1 Tax=Actinoplanes sp. OR16 TaxID=946334 RepID=UPI000F70C448|nr:hypothetical protein [Actinoplanes sp. OR16]BBH69599.1 hypothetical protein ACTI_62840 [Actinoplanes sp. OR16]
MALDVTHRPTTRWRRQVDDQAAAVAAGTLDAGKAYAAELWPPAFLAAADAVLVTLEREAAALSATASDEQIWAVVQHAVEGLNAADDGHIETGEREALADYVDGVLTGAGIDVPALTARRGRDRHELTDQWRQW